MAALPPPSERRRPRPGSLERPVSGRTYRGTALLVAIPLLIAAFTVGRPARLPPPTLPPAFDEVIAHQAAVELARAYPDRFPGSPGADRAARWLSQRLRSFGFRVRSDGFEAVIPARGRVGLQNLLAVAPGRSNEAIVVMAHRDNAGTGPGANDNASGTAALLELARSYALRAAPSAAQPTSSAGPTHTILFLSTDGGAFGGLGAARFAETSPYRERMVAVINLVAIGGTGGPRIELAGDRPRSPDPVLVHTAAARILQRTGEEAARPALLPQLIDLAFPFSLYEHAPFVGRGIPAITLTTSGARPPQSFGDTPARLSGRRLAQVGRSAEALLGSLDEGVELPGRTSSYLDLGNRVVQGWAVKLALVAALLPFLLTAIDLFARCRRRRIAVAPALRSYRSRLAFWLWVGFVFALLALLGVWADGAARPLSPDSPAARGWPLLGLAAFGLLAGAGWLVGRDRLLPRRPTTTEEELAGHTAALLVLAVVALLVVATNPFALVFLLPSLHAWLWLPQVRDRPPWVRGGVLIAGFSGPLLLLGSFAWRFGLGLDAPWYLAQLAAVGYVPLPGIVIFLAWLAAAGQLAALAAGRYAPYPAAAERPPRGPLRELVRKIVLAVRARHKVAVLPQRRAAGG